MKLMHTKLPDFIAKVHTAAKKLRPDMKVTVKGLENIETAKLASLRVGRIEDEIIEVTEDPFRAVNFQIGKDGIMHCPNGKAFHFQYRKHVYGNQYGRQEEVYQCEDCSGCPYTERCKKADKNRTVRINHELTSMHQEVIDNLESIHGALLRMNRSIQAEGTFGIMKNDRWYKRIVRRGIKSVQLEVFLVSIGQNLYKFHNKQKKVSIAA